MTPTNIPPIWQQWMESNRRDRIANVSVRIKHPKYKDKIGQLYNAKTDMPGYYSVRLANGTHLALTLSQVEPVTT